MFLLSDRLNLAGLLVAPPVSGAALLVLALSSSLLVGGSLDALTDEALTLGADHVQNALERAAPHHQATLDLSPLLLAEHAVSSAVNEELLLQLESLPSTRPARMVSITHTSMSEAGTRRAEAMVA